MELLLDREELKYYNQDIFANTAVKTLFDISQQDTENKFVKMFQALEILQKQQPDNIVLRNASKHFLFELSENKINEKAKERYNTTLKLLKESNKSVAQIGSKRIKAGSTVFISSFNNQLTSILTNAAKHKLFTVFTVKEESKVYNAFLKKLKSQNINLVEIDWHTLNKSLEKADICLIGGETLTNKKGVFVKKGGHTVAETAQKNNVPVYVCLHTLKYDHKNIVTNHLIEQKNLDYLPKNLVNSYVCEQGIFKPEHIIQESKFHNKKLFT